MSNNPDQSSLPRYKWTFRETDPHSSRPGWEALVGKLGCDPILARVLVARGIDTADEAKAFLNPREKDILPPEAIPGLEEARDRLSAACLAKEPVLVHGDYDADGIIGAVILHRTLKEYGCRSRIFLPERNVHGYGMAPQAVKKAESAGIKLLVSVDCGISSNHTVELARQASIEVIITDHHDIPDQLPEDALLVHPELEGDYRGGKIAGATVAFKLALSLIDALGGDVDAARERYLPLVALATVADVCSLQKENRSLVALGMSGMFNSGIPGLRALCLGTRREGESGPITARDISFGMAPVLNAAGRLGDPLPAAKLLLAKDDDTAWRHFRVLQQMNQDRRRIQEEICRRLMRNPDVAYAGPDAGLLVIADDNCTPGLAGIAAARLADETGRPTCILAPIKTEDGIIYRGSMRRAGGEDLTELMDPVAGIVEDIGGHPGALGLTVGSDSLNRFIAACGEIAWTPRTQELELDFPVETPLRRAETVQALDATRPWGEGNPQPGFAWGPITVKGTRAVGRNGDHMQFSLGGADGSMCKGIGFSMSRLLPSDGGLGQKIRAAGHFMINNWQGMESVEFQLRDLEFA